MLFEWKTLFATSTILANYFLVRPSEYSHYLYQKKKNKITQPSALAS